ELRAAIAINPYNSGWHYNLGLTLDELGRYSEALECYERALKIEGDDVGALHRMALDLGRLGKPEESLATFGRLEAVDATYEPSYCDRIRLYCELGQHEKAEEMFYIARQYKDECPDCFFNIGDSLSRRRK